jgi:hypothetical protein
VLCGRTELFKNVWLAGELQIVHSLPPKGMKRGNYSKNTPSYQDLPLQALSEP